MSSMMFVFSRDEAKVESVLCFCYDVANGNQEIMSPVRMMGLVSDVDNRSFFSRGCTSTVRDDVCCSPSAIRRRRQPRPPSTHPSHIFLGVSEASQDADIDDGSASHHV